MRAWSWLAADSQVRLVRDACSLLTRVRRGCLQVLLPCLRRDLSPSRAAFWRPTAAPIFPTRGNPPFNGGIYPSGRRPVSAAPAPGRRCSECAQAAPCAARAAAAVRMSFWPPLSRAGSRRWRPAHGFRLVACARGHTSDRTDVRAVISESLLKRPPRIAGTHARPVPRDAVGWARDARRQRVDRQAHRKRHAIDALDHQQRIDAALRGNGFFTGDARAASPASPPIRARSWRDAPCASPADATARYAKRPCAQHPAAPFPVPAAPPPAAMPDPPASGRKTTG